MFQAKAERPADEVKLHRLAVRGRLLTRPAAALPIDRAAVVGIDEIERPELVALVDVRQAGGSETEQQRAERCVLAGGCNLLHEGLEVIEEILVLVERADETLYALLVALVWLDPARAPLRLS